MAPEQPRTPDRSRSFPALACRWRDRRVIVPFPIVGTECGKMAFGTSFSVWVLQALLMLAGIAGVALAATILYRGRQRTVDQPKVVLSGQYPRNAGGYGRRRG